MSNEILRTAIAFARRGFLILPLQPEEKVPEFSLAPNGAHDATTNEGTIRYWWDLNSTLNVGVTQRFRLVIDADRRKNGDHTLAELQDRHGDLPATWTSVTGDGEHYWFALPEGADIRGGNDRLGPGVDVKTGPGSYVVAPPSVHPSGVRYQWRPDHHPAEVSLAVAPAWVIDLLTPPPPPPAKPFCIQTDDDQRVADALRRIPADDRDVWWRIGAALKAHFGEKGRDLWDRWSATSDKFDEHRQAKEWKSFQRDRLGLGTIFHYVRKSQRAA